MKWDSRQQVTPRHSLLKWQDIGCTGVLDHNEFSVKLFGQSEMNFKGNQKNTIQNVITQRDVKIVKL